MSNRTVKLYDSTTQQSNEVSAPARCTWGDFKSIAGLDNKRGRVAQSFSNGRDNWILEDSDFLPEADGLMIFLVEGKTKAGV